MILRTFLPKCTLVVVLFVQSTQAKVIKITSDAQFKKEIKDSKKKSLLDFSAEWCGPCKNLKPTFKKVSDMPIFKDINFVEIDVDKNRKVADEYKVRSMPTLVYLDENGKEIKRVSGGKSEKELTTEIKSVFKIK